MSESNTTDERGVLVLVPELPQLPPRGRFTLLISDSFCFEVSETKDGARLDFRTSSPRPVVTPRSKKSEVSPRR